MWLVMRVEEGGVVGDEGGGGGVVDDEGGGGRCGW